MRWTLAQSKCRSHCGRPPAMIATIPGICAGAFQKPPAAHSGFRAAVALTGSEQGLGNIVLPLLEPWLHYHYHQFATGGVETLKELPQGES